MDKDAAEAALKSGDAARCIAMLAPELERTSDARLIQLLGEACHRAGDDPLLDRAADRLAQLNPAAPEPYVWKGDMLWRAGDRQRAALYYNALLDRMAGQPVSAELGRALDLAEARLEVLHSDLLAYFETYLTDHGLPPERRSPRIARAIRVMAGLEADTLELQRPTVQYIPGLPQIAWYARQDFGWASALEAETDAIREELLSVLADDTAFTPYIEGNTHGPARDYQGLLANPAWSAFYLWKNGERVEVNIARCPRAAAALEAVPRPAIPGRSPTAMFSLLKPGTHIPPHHGMLNARLICHLPRISRRITACSMRG